MNIENLTIVIPCKNEGETIGKVVADATGRGCRVIVVDDASTDNTGEIAVAAGAEVVHNRRSKGNGGAVKIGLAMAETEFVGVMDGDGQHSVSELLKLYAVILDQEADLVVGSRSRSGQASLIKYLANQFYNFFASFMVGKKVEDLTSGQRVFRVSKVQPIIWLLPNTFSYPTTSTMVFYRLGYDVMFEPISVAKSVSKSNIKIFRDGFRFFLIIMKVGTLFSPFKLFLPVSLLMFLLGSLRYLYTFSTQGTFTNMSALFYVTAVLVFLMGVLSEQIATVTIGKISQN